MGRQDRAPYSATKSRVAQVSRLRPGIRTTDDDWKPHPPLVSLGALLFLWGRELDHGSPNFPCARRLLGLIATLLLDFEQMATVQEFRCEICGLVTSNPTHWFVIQCGDSTLTVHRWNTEAANTEGARHYCGEAHAEVYISRWFESVCTPPKPTYK
jgi:hypothetical protein